MTWLRLSEAAAAVLGVGVEIGRCSLGYLLLAAWPLPWVACGAPHGLEGMALGLAEWALLLTVGLYGSDWLRNRLWPRRFRSAPRSGEEEDVA